jgi:predicted permease
MRYAIRALARDPRFTIPAILALALAIGANASVFTVVHSVLLQPLPMRRSQELVSVVSVRPDGTRYPFNIANFLDLRDCNRVLSDLAASAGFNANLTGEANPERLPGVRVTPNFFEVLGVEAALGRTILADDGAPGRSKIVVLTWRLWQRRYGADRGILGRTIRLNGEPHVVVGVLPPLFTFRNGTAEFATPLLLDMDPNRDKRTSTAFLAAYGRLQPGVTLRAARANLDTIAAQLRSVDKANAGITGIDAVPLREDLTAGVRPMLLTLMAAVGLVLLIACVNISALWVARSAGRRREIAIRAALGATRARLTGQALLEGVLLAVCGGALGTMLTFVGVPLLLSLTPDALPRAREVQIDGWVLAGSGGLALLCGFLLGALPALQARPDGLNDRGNAAARGRLRSGLVVAEVALALMLLTGAGLAMRSFHRLSTLDPGFRTENLITFRLSLPVARYGTPEALARFRDRLHGRIAAIPGVEAAGAVSILPLSGPLGAADFTIVGDPPPTLKEKPTADYRMIDAEYLGAMRIPILRGRGLTEADNERGRPVVVVSEAAVRRYWKGREPVGSHILLQDTSKGPREVEVVGVSGSVRESGLDQPASTTVFVPIPQIPPDLARFLANNFFWAIRGRAGVDVAEAARRVIQGFDGDIAAADSTMERYVEAALAARRFSLRILAAFGLAALLAAGGGLYALVAYTTAARTREIGIRVAMGAEGGDIARMVLGQGISLAAMGVVLGTACAWVLTRYAESLLFEIGRHDAAAIGGAAGLMIAVAAAASWIPSRRAARVDPVEALRGS